MMKETDGPSRMHKQNGKCVEGFRRKNLEGKVSLGELDAHYERRLK